MTDDRTLLLRPFVSFIGAGPGDAGLLTLRGQQALAQADVVLFDYLANPELLKHCPQAQTIYVGKKGFSEYMSQKQINTLIVQQALFGVDGAGSQRVARLKGGDVFVFGRGGEEAEACVQNGIPFEIIPGITSAIAAPAYAGIPVTHREVARSFAVITGNTQAGGAKYQQLSGVDTLVLLMGVKNLDQIAAELIETGGRDPQTPAATIQWGSTPLQRVVTGTLQTIAGLVQQAGLEAPAVTVVGQVVKLRDTLRWFDTDPSQTNPNQTNPSQTNPSQTNSSQTNSSQTNQMNQSANLTVRPLAGRHIAVTRTRVGASKLSGVLRQLGAIVLEIPLIRFAETADEPALHRQLQMLAKFDWLLLSSNQAVEALFLHLNKLGLDARALASLKIGAVGPSTAQSLLERGIRADFVPTQFGAKHLGAELPLKHDEKVLHLSSQIAEAELEQALAKRGFKYTRAELYRTEPTTLTPTQVQQLRQAEVITLASGSAARHLAALAAELNLTELNLTELKVAAMGPQTASAASAVGFKQVVVAENPSLEALAEAVVLALADA